LNYRHAYHAGNHGDVLKHAVLVALIERLQEKSTPIFLLDTHAGVGLYDLGSVEAGKTKEWRSGIGRLAGGGATGISRYLSIVGELNEPGELRTYPGSPAIAAAMMRPGDRLVLAELHPEDAHLLRSWARLRSGIAVHARDGYEAIRAFLPPREGRGLVLVDPPYEAADEFERLGAAIIEGHQRWPGGRWMIWHPIKDRAPVWRLQERLIAAKIPQLISAELLVGPVDGMSLAGSGLILVNPPFGLESWLETLLAELQTILAPEHGSHALVRLGET
jgi:23S rRNA (adenine2030-N6)-methyltransferase